ncbi:MAG: hypothetical protein ACSNEK_06865 [Parachlamydiaceae bacterium]
MVKKSTDAGIEEKKIIKRPVEKTICARSEDSLKKRERLPSSKKEPKSLRLENKIITAEGKERKRQRKV